MFVSVWSSFIHRHTLSLSLTHTHTHTHIHTLTHTHTPAHTHTHTHTHTICLNYILVEPALISETTNCCAMGFSPCLFDSSTAVFFCLALTKAESPCPSFSKDRLPLWSSRGR